MENLHTLSWPITCFGECFFCLSENKFIPSGFPLSIAFHLKMLGADPVLISRVGLDDDGKKIIQFMEESGLNTDCFQVDYDLPTRTGNSFKSDNITEAWNNLSPDDSCFKAVNESSLVIHSTHPMAFEASRRALYLLIQQKSRRVVYLAPGFSNLLKESVQHCLQDAYILYLHVRELDLLTGWFSPTFITDRVSLVQSHFNIFCVIVMDENGGYRVHANDKAHLLPASKSPLESKSGTAFLAGFLSACVANKSIEQALEFGSRLHLFIDASLDEYMPYVTEEIPE